MIINKILLALCYFTAIYTSQNNTITLFHKLNSRNELASVQKNGLLSFNQAYEQGLTQASLDRVLKVKLDQRKEDNIYFDPTQKPDAEIALQVAVENLYVYNAAYRKISDWPAYNNSKILLSVYLQKLADMEKLQQQYPDKKIALHPNNCEAIIFAITKHLPSTKRCKFESHQVTAYEAEVALPARKIAPENLIFITT